MSFITILYNIIAIPLLALVVAVLKPFNKKLRERERNWENVLFHFRASFPPKKKFRIWFHSASMGEFEQAKPIIEKLKKNNPDIEVIVSFYSPSGYNNQKDYKLADAVLYMPFDSRANARYFIRTIKPDLAIFIRYEIWRNHLCILNKKNIPTYLICATKPNWKYLYECFFLRPFTKTNYSFFKKIYTVSEEHTEFFKDLKIGAEVQTLSDTRFDRIIENVERAKQNQILPPILFNKNDFKLVAGSTWEADEEILIEAEKLIDKKDKTNLRLIIVPHEPVVKHIKKLKEILPNSFLLSQIEEFLSKEKDNHIISGFLGKNHIIVDCIGKLLNLYSIADAAYIGGGFGAGVHSVTEPAGYGLPLACGPKMTNSPDAIKFETFGSLKVVTDKESLSSWLNKIITNHNFKKQAGNTNKDYIFKFKGASDKIARDIEEIIHRYNN